AGGIGTTIFYLTIGRTGSVSDIDYIARTHAMTKTQATLLYGAIAGSHIWRMSRDSHYADFFVRARGGSAQLGLSFGALSAPVRALGARCARRPGPRSTVHGELPSPEP